MTEKTFDDLCDLMLIETDKIALETFEPGTPLFTFQQNLIKGAAQYRLSKVKDDEQNRNS